MIRTPPYLKRHADRLCTDASATVWVAIGKQAWSWAKEHERSHIATLCTPGEDPAAFDWSLCARHDPHSLVSIKSREAHL